MAWEPLPEDRPSDRHLSASLEVLRDRYGLARQDGLVQLRDVWPRLVGADLALQCSPDAVVGGRLVVLVADPAIADALRWQARDLLAAANEVLGGTVVDELRIRLEPSWGNAPERAGSTPVDPGRTGA